MSMSFYSSSQDILKVPPQKKCGILLLNLGSPNTPDAVSVRPFLKEFLSDKRVIEMPAFKWQPILRGIILPFRSKTSAALYRKIWQDDGSPLILHTHNLAMSLQQKLQIPVYEAMTYGNPSVFSVLQKVEQDKVNRLIVVPLFPQYASSSRGAALDALWRAVLKMRVQPSINVVPSFFDFVPYIQTIANRIELFWKTHGKPQKLIFSFHGIPMKQHEAGDVYVAECTHTASEIAKTLGLSSEEYCLTFQSRFGRAAWVEPSTQDVLAKLPKDNIKNIDICCPGFVCDCLETLEEIAISGKKIFQNAGGENYRYIPCLNSQNDSAKMFSQLIKNHLYVND